ncbi:MAG TPA: hypothetical protein VNT03_03300 [Baekduia sp.]|nr:hypothetical protein [Baekduia sp.]
MKEHPVITESHPAPSWTSPTRDGEPCPSCGAPLAGDQRYCLHCGVRRPEARLEFLDVLDADVRARSATRVAGPVTFAGSEPRGLNGRLQANAGLLALGALLLLMLLIGLLVGHWATGDPSAPAAATPAPQVIKVEGAAAPAATSGGSGAGGASEGADGEASSSKSAHQSSAKDGASSSAKAPKGAVSVKNLKSKKAVDDAVKKGKPISTGTGKLPPKDDKPAGGGSGFEEIG